MLPDLESLRCFQAAAIRLNFRAAARSVSLSPAAFSDRIQRLEATLGCTLFVRTTRRVRLSPDGERLLPQAQKALAEAARCAEVVGTGKEVPFELTLGTRWELGLSWLLPAVQQLKEDAPHQRLHLAFGNGAPLLERMIRGQIDAVVGSMRVPGGKLDYVPLHEECYSLVASPKTLARHPLKKPADAQHHTLVDTAESLDLFRYWLDRAPSQKSWIFGKTRFLGAISAIRKWVTEEDGVAVLPLYFIQAELDAGQLVPILPEVEPASDWFRLIWLKGHPREVEIREIGHHLCQTPLR
jgi:LysR family transcriptional regulator, glycine cleavage system transcriptional activator